VESGNFLYSLLEFLVAPFATAFSVWKVEISFTPY